MPTEQTTSPSALDSRIAKDLQAEPQSLAALDETAKRAPNPRRFVAMAIVGAVAIVIGYKAWGAYTFAQTHVDTDNAYITGDLVNIGPQVSGTLTHLNVEDGSFVHKGDLIATLDRDTAGAELAEAQANLQAVESQIPEAESSLAYTRLSTAAAIKNSQAVVATQAAKTQGSRMQVRLSADTVKNQIVQAESQLAQAKAQAAQAQAGIGTANAGLTNAHQAVQTAKRNAEADHAGVLSAAAESDRAAKDLQRYESLFKADAVSRQQYDTVAAGAASSAASLTSAQRKAEAAESEVGQAESAVTQAESQLSGAKSQALAAAKQVQVAVAGVGIAAAGRTQVSIQGANVETNEGQATQADAQLQAAQAGVEQIALREKQVSTARAQLLQAQAAVEHAKVRVGQTNLYAPCDGYVVKHTANVGTAINPGQTVVTMTRGNDVWIMANFKETQLSNVREGQPTEFQVDAFPGKVFKGHVDSISGGTGAVFALLPPDNATGNFTKVVQRVPVKITLDPGQKDLERLTVGMSVNATIDTASKQ